MITAVRSRDIVTLAVTILLLSLALMASPSAADPPTDFDFEFTDTDENPCTGLDHEITVSMRGRLHQHGDQELLHARRSGTTDSGYVMDHGVSNETAKGGFAVTVVNEVWSNDDGSKFKVHQVWIRDFVTDETYQLQYHSECIRP